MTNALSAISGDSSQTLLGLVGIKSREEWAALSPDFRQDVRARHFQALACRNPNWMVSPSMLERSYPDDQKPYEVRDGIAVIKVLGPLVNRESWWYASYPEIRRMVADAATDPAIKGILLALNSPGGETDGAFETADDIEAAAELKPLWAVADADAFSAAYLLGSAASRLYVQPQTGGVGSIGVICQHVEYSEYLKREGVAVTSVYEGERKNDFSPYQPLTKGARAVLEQEVGRLYGLFVDAVARRRKMTTEAVRATQAGLYFGASGISAGLADQAGGLRDAFAAFADFLSATGSPARSTFRTTVPAVKSTTEEVGPMAEQTTATAAADQGQLDVESIRRDAAAQGYGDAAEVAQLCMLAGMPGRAMEYLSAKTPLATVRKELLALRAAETARDEINSNQGRSAAANTAAAGPSLAESMKAQLARLGRMN